jgi:hypothetical protein
MKREYLKDMEGIEVGFLRKRIFVETIIKNKIKKENFTVPYGW